MTGGTNKSGSTAPVLFAEANFADGDRREGQDVGDNEEHTPGFGDHSGNAGDEQHAVDVSAVEFLSGGGQDDASLVVGCSDSCFLAELGSVAAPCLACGLERACRAVHGVRCRKEVFGRDGSPSVLESFDRSLNAVRASLDGVSFDRRCLRFGQHQEPQADLLVRHEAPCQLAVKQQLVSRMIGLVLRPAVAGGFEVRNDQGVARRREQVDSSQQIGDTGISSPRSSSSMPISVSSHSAARLAWNTESIRSARAFSEASSPPLP